MPIEIRTNSALFKRAEQLKRWRDSETNKTEVDIPPDKIQKIKFSEGCVFLAACAAGDTEEVERLLEQDADINTANVDGLTALHQACIDDNIDMVQFLVEHDCDVNRGDNEGWTPLHATASCGFTHIAKYLIEHGADVAAVNNDGDLPLDIAESEEMEELLQDEIDRLDIDCDDARSEEERVMLEDAKQWVNNKFQDKVHPKTGATALHVASAKGYNKVMSLLIQAGADLNAQDNDGWTPLHAAAHWGQKDACAIMADNLANMDIQNYAGQTCFDVADPDLVKLLEELKKKQASMQKDRPEIQAILQRKGKPPLKRRTSVTRMSGQEKSKSVMKDTKAERAQIQAKLRLPEEDVDEDKKAANEEVLVSIIKKDESAPKVEKVLEHPKDEKEQVPSKNETYTEKSEDNSAKDKEDESSWRRAHRRPADPLNSEVQKTQLQEQEIAAKKPKTCAEDKEDATNGPLSENESESRDDSEDAGEPLTNPPTEPSNEIITTSSPSTPSDASLESQAQIRRTFVYPVRDDESEAQRKAHAKRVRETRRSTQGVTLEDLKSAEQQLLRKQQEEDERREQEQALSESSENNSRMSFTERRLRRSRMEEEEKDSTCNASEDAGAEISSGNKLLQSQSSVTEVPEASQSVTVRIRSDTDLKKEQDNDSRTTLGTQAAIQRRRRPKRRSTGVVYIDGDDVSQEEKENGEMKKEGDESNIDFTSEESKGSERYRNRYGSSTSVQDSGSEVSSRAETPSKYSASSISSSRGSLIEDIERDYKRLYEDMKKKNERLQEKLERTEEELDKTKKQLQKALQNNAKTSISDVEKKERRALERKVSELEEELKEMEKLRADNQRLKDENGALIRVISKLSK